MVRYRLSKAELNIFHYNVAKTILFWLICVYAETMTGFGGILSPSVPVLVFFSGWDSERLSACKIRGSSIKIGGPSILLQFHANWNFQKLGVPAESLACYI